jgi:hypothetical protein
VREGGGRNSRSGNTVAGPVNEAGFNSRRQNNRNWISGTTRWTGDGDRQESPGQVCLRHGPRAQVLREGRERESEREREREREREN